MSDDPRGGPPWSETELQAALLAGADLFDGGAFWESHEAWEAAWHRAPEPERAFFQGLIHAAAACLHHQRGNRVGYDKQVARMRRRLGRYVPEHRGVDTEGLLHAVDALAGLDTGAPYPRLGLDDRG